MSEFNNGKRLFNMIIYMHIYFIFRRDQEIEKHKERERQEREKLERERQEREKKEREEKERKEQQRITEQAVHKHFEESLRLAAQTKVITLVKGVRVRERERANE